MSLSIRRASIDDIPSIVELVSSCIVSSKSDAITGLIDYPVPTAEKYLKKMSNGRLYVAETDLPKSLVGFIDAYESKHLSSVFRGDELINEMLLLEHEPFLYLNTVAINPIARRQGLCKRFFDIVIGELPEKYSRAWTCIVHKPIKNEISSRMAQEKLDFKLVGEFKTSYDITFGLYRCIVPVVNS